MRKDKTFCSQKGLFEKKKTMQNLIGMDGDGSLMLCGSVIRRIESITANSGSQCRIFCNK